MKKFEIVITVKNKRVPVPQKAPKVQTPKTVYDRRKKLIVIYD